MKKDKFLIIGNGGRESSFARKLSEDSILYAVLSHKNPTILKEIEKTNGKYLIGDINDGNVIASFVIENNIDYVFVSSDEPLANGVVDILLKNNIKTIGPTKEGAKIEWDKIYSIKIMQEILPEFTPFFKEINSVADIEKSILFFENKNLEIVVKPQGLTGGKGVKVMGEHLKDYHEVRNYIKKLLDKKEKVLLVEKLSGIEFTIMGITDGINLFSSPASYDYPYRYNNDKGAGTGGMGCFTDKKKYLPFMQESDYEDCVFIMKKITKYLLDNNIHFNGVINGGFFLTKDGIKFMEFNGRFGDPEGINILSILDCSFSEMLRSIYHKKLTQEKVKFINKASVVKYLVSPNYPKKGSQITFSLLEKEIEKEGVSISFSSAVKNDDGTYKTVSSSRVVGIGYVADSIIEASEKINEIIEKYCDKRLEYRSDIGSKENLHLLNI